MSHFEAPISLTFEVVTPAGFPALFTVRDDERTGFLSRVVEVEKNLVNLGFKPRPARTFGGGAKPEKDWIQGRTCPKDGGRLFNNVTASGKKMIKCENSKWNPTTKQSYGCDFIEWVNDTPNTAPAAPTKVMNENVDPDDIPIPNEPENEVPWEMSPSEEAEIKGDPLTASQKTLIAKMIGNGRIKENINFATLTKREASALITKYKDW
jgi:hypothetical protein